jgi:protein gp37
MRAMYEVPHHKYIILTKNPERMHNTLKHFSPGHFDHVYFGTSVDGGIMGAIRLKILKRVHDLGFKTVISFEPLLQNPRDLIDEADGIDWADWVIVGGQTNPEILPDLNWLYTISAAYRNGKPLFIKGNADRNHLWDQKFPDDLLQIAQSWGKA